MVTRSNGIYSRKFARGLLDGRTHAGRYVRHTKAELLKHLGREPTFPERLLIEQTAIIALRLSLAAEKVASGRVLGPMDNNQLIAWHNSLRRNLVELGMQPATPPTKTPSLADLFPGRGTAA